MTRQKYNWGTDNLGLAAYSLACDASITKVEKRTFYIESDSSEDDMNLHYVSSGERKFNNHLIALMKMRRKNL